MEQRSKVGNFVIPDTALERVMGYIEDPRDREAISLVCRRWYHVDALSRKHVTITICYSTSPDRVRRRFPNLESLKLNGKPRASMFNLIPEDWGGYAGPWVHGIAEALSCLKTIYFRRMIVRDDDIGVLVRARGDKLKSLKLDKCSEFSMDSLNWSPVLASLRPKHHHRLNNSNSVIYSTYMTLRSNMLSFEE
ncbi:coronatine-insensitive protein homolog 1b-like isoform X1 [Musa acuminata AAA Group]|uniref:coronatine-insensitive protein homolog 1b-like isoform X1 n=1 Tax=Musa acuminata AAA Group TaxID=214697 RepID=UPI0031D7ACF4